MCELHFTMSLTANLAENYGSSQAVLGLLHSMRPFMVLQCDHDYVRNTFYLAVGHVQAANNDCHFDHPISRILSGQVLWHSFTQNSTSRCLQVTLSIPPTFCNSNQVQMAGPVNQGTDNAGQVNQDTQTTNSCVQDNSNAQDVTGAQYNASLVREAANALNSLSSGQPLADCLRDITNQDWSFVEQSTTVKSESVTSGGGTPPNRGQKRAYEDVSSVSEFELLHHFDCNFTCCLIFDLCQF